MAEKVRAIPEGYQTVTPGLCIRGAAEAIEFYKRAFGAEERFRMEGPGGLVAHAEIRVGNATVMLGDEMPGGTKSVQALGGSPVWFYVYVQDVDAALSRAIDAGAKPGMPASEMFWGDRVGEVIDPFGLRWSFATHVKDLSPEQVRQGHEAWLREKGFRT